MKILLVGETHFGSRTPQRAQALRDLGHEVTAIGTAPADWTYETKPRMIDRILYRLRLPLDRANAGEALARAAKGHDLVLLDNARAIRPWALRAALQANPAPKIVWFSEDDMLNPEHRTWWTGWSLGLFDLCVTTKSFNARPEELSALGARRVLFVNNTYCPHTHRPILVDEAERKRCGAPVSFVGTFESPRAAMVLALTRAGIPVRVWGNGWRRLREAHPLLTIEHKSVYGDDYRRVVAASQVNLCFLRHANRDLQTCRSIEIPAMGGFMLHEQSHEMAALLAPDREAAYFRDADDLVGRCRFWLDSGKRESITAAGHARVVNGGFSHAERWRTILERIS